MHLEALIQYKFSLCKQENCENSCLPAREVWHQHINVDEMKFVQLVLQYFEERKWDRKHYSIVLPQPRKLQETGGQMHISLSKQCPPFGLMQPESLSVVLRLGIGQIEKEVIWLLWINHWRAEVNMFMTRQDQTFTIQCGLQARTGTNTLGQEALAYD